MQLYPGLRGTQRAGGGPTVSVIKASESRGKVRPTATYDLARGGMDGLIIELTYFHKYAPEGGKFPGP